LASFALAPLIVVAQSGGSSAAGEASSTLSERARLVIGANMVQQQEYVRRIGSDPLALTVNEAARIPGYPVRQHPVNVGAFSSGCAQCHRLAGPLPPDNDAPPDVFDQLPSEAITAPAPAGFTRLTTSAAREEYPSWRPDGSGILYEAADAEGRYNLWFVGVDGSGARQLTDHAAAGWASWSPDGARFVYWASDAPGTGNLWRFDLDAGTAEQVTYHVMAAWPQWSPDGRVIAYQARDDAGWTLRLLDVATLEQRDLTDQQDALPSRPMWSPDGASLLYQSLVGTRFELTRVSFGTDAAGAPDYQSDTRRSTITTQFPIDIGAATQHGIWRPQGDRIAFAMYALEIIPVGGVVMTYKTYLAAPDGARPTLALPGVTLADRSPTWSPDGAWLATWSWDPDARAGVWLADADATQRIELTADLGGDALYPAWSPDGSKVAFAANREGTFDIWVADVAVAAPEVLAGAGVRAGP